MELQPGHSMLLLLLLSAIISSLFTPSVVVADTTPVEYCNKKANYPVTVKGVEITPSPVQRGKETSFSIMASSGDVISKGKFVVDVTYLIFHVYKQTYDLCSETSCPVSSGDFVLSHKQTLPGFTPPGSYSITMKMLGEHNEQLACFSFGFSIGFISSSVADI